MSTFITVKDVQAAEKLAQIKASMASLKKEADAINAALRPKIEGQLAGEKKLTLDVGGRTVTLSRVHQNRPAYKVICEVAGVDPEGYRGVPGCYTPVDSYSLKVVGQTRNKPKMKR